MEIATQSPQLNTEAMLTCQWSLSMESVSLGGKDQYLHPKRLHERNLPCVRA
jgi:hypothetical protein